MVAKKKHVTGSFSGDIRIVGGSHVVFDNMKGTIGKQTLTGHGFGNSNGT